MGKPKNAFDLADGDLALDRPRATLTDAIADKLREFILLEKLPPGAAISERDVSTALGVSRTPLRGALALLEREGLVEYTVSRRPRVADPSIGEIADNLAVMGAIEALGGELACARAGDADIARAAELDRKMREGAGRLDPVELFRADMRFHETIVAAGGNGALIETHRQYIARLWRARFISSRRRSGREQTMREHAAILDALRRRDVAGTAQAMRDHMVSATANCRLAMAERGQSGTV